MDKNNNWEAYFEANRKQWDSRVEPHQSAELYKMERFLVGETSLNSIELNGVGDVKGKSLLHLQCHFGQDTLSWARLGAKATGVDISPVAIAKAKSLNEQLQLDATFLESDIYALSEKLAQQYDIVFTSYGTIIWLPDLDRWAQVIAQALAPNGIFYIADFHPTLMLLNFDNHQIEYDYFNKGVIEETQTHTYTGQPLPEPIKEYFWQHSLSEIMQALLKNGLQIVDFQEFDCSPYDCFPNFKRIGDSHYQFNGFNTSFPHVFAIKARKL